MKLTTDFLSSRPDLTNEFTSSSLLDRELFFTALLDLASTDLALAHSVFKTSSVRTVLFQTNRVLSKNSIGSFSTYKPFDTIELQDDKLYGKKHWVTNSFNADVVIAQVKTDQNIMLVKTVLPKTKVQFLDAPGMMDTDTRDLVFEGEAATPLFLKTDPKYLVVSKHNILAFIANYIGATKGLLESLTNVNDLLAEYKNLRTAFTNCILSSDESVTDDYWHKRNALYLQAKKLLVKTLQYILEFSAGNYYNLNSVQSKHFFNCVIYSGHNGSVQSNYKTLYTEPQDY